MKLYGSEGLLLMEVASIMKNDRNISIKGKMMGQIPMTIMVQPGDVRAALRMLSFPVILQLVRMLFLADKTKD